MTLELAGEKQSFNLPGIRIGYGKEPRTLDCPTLAFFGWQWAKGRLLLPVLLLQPEVYQPGTTVDLEGSMASGILLDMHSGEQAVTFEGMFFGKLKLDAAGRTPNAPVSGSIQADYYHFAP